MLIQTKLDIDHSHFPSEWYKVLYILFRIEGRILGILSPCVKEDVSVSIRIIKRAFKFLEDIFENRYHWRKICLDLGQLYFKEGGDYYVFYIKFIQFFILIEIDQSEYKKLLANRFPPFIILHINWLEDNKNISFEEFEIEVSIWMNSVDKLIQQN